MVLFWIPPGSPIPEVDYVEYNTTIGRFQQTIWWKDGHVADFVMGHEVPVPDEEGIQKFWYWGREVWVKNKINVPVYTRTVDDPEALDRVFPEDRMNFTTQHRTPLTPWK